LTKKSDNQIYMKSAKNGKASRRSQPKPRARVTKSVKGSRVISATEAARSFSELLDRVCYRGESFVIERGGEPVCEMSHVQPLRFSGADFLTVLHSLPKPDPRYWKAVEKATKQVFAVPRSPWES
jgi:antitoxin (DNA-binding transcriptional repressor) of toxin-antitoxin stability system